MYISPFTTHHSLTTAVTNITFFFKQMGTWNSSIENISQRLNLTVIRRRPSGSKHALGVGKVRVAAALVGAI